MKKKIISLGLVVIMLLTMLVPVTGYAYGISVKINGNPVYFDQPPILMNGRTMVPVRAIFEAMGCTVLWDDKNQTIDVATEFGMMIMTVNSNYIIYRNENEDRSIFTDVPPKIVNNRTLVPVRAIAECTGYKVDWDDATQTVLISGEIKGLTIPDVYVPGYYANTKTPDFGVCFNIDASKIENGEYVYNGVTGKQVIEYIESYLAGSGFLIDYEKEIFGQFYFTLSNNKTGETVNIYYSKSTKYLRVTLSVG